MHRGFIKLWRKIQEWEWFKDSHTLHLFLHFLLTANYKDTKYRGQNIPRGSLVCGRKTLSLSTGISQRAIRTSIEHLKTTNEVTIKTTNKFSIISLCNYESYQSTENETDQQNVNKAETTDQQPTTSKECKKDKKEIYMPSIDEVRAYCKERNNTVDPEKWFDFYASKGWMIGKNKMRDWRAAVRTWEKNQTDKPQQPVEDGQAWRKQIE